MLYARKSNFMNNIMNFDNFLSFQVAVVIDPKEKLSFQVYMFNFNRFAIAIRFH